MILFLRCGFLLGCVLAASSARAGQQEELENLRSRIATVQRDMDKTSESKAEAADALRESERAISDSNRKLAALATEQRAADLKLGELRAQQQQLADNMSGQQVLLGRLLYQQYLGGQQEYAKLLLGNQDPNQVARNLQYYRYIARNRVGWLNNLRANLHKVTALGEATREQRAALAAVREEQKSQQQSLQQKQRERQQMLVKISQQLRGQRREIHRLQRDENRLAQLVEKITRMLAQPKSRSLFRNDKLPDNRFDGKPFGQLKGKLAFPVKGHHQPLRRVAPGQHGAMERHIRPGGERAECESNRRRASGVCRLAARFRQSAHRRPWQRIHEPVWQQRNAVQASGG